MTQEMVFGIGNHALRTIVLVTGPILAVSLVVGLTISMFQAVTQINEMTLTVVPKIIAIFVVLVVLGPWMLNTMLDYTAATFGLLSTLGR